jgi:hypothetical protein
MSSRRVISQPNIRPAYPEKISDMMEIEVKAITQLQHISQPAKILSVLDEFASADLTNIPDKFAYL